MRCIIFVGPTISLAEAKNILPDAEYFPPARQSDFLSIVRERKPDIIGLIDGEFSQSLAVWHKEILDALARGIHVYGSSSMGAIRAAECADFGMVGIGHVARAFSSYQYTNDDTVALCYDSDYKKISEPLCNILFTTAKMVSNKAITKEQAEKVQKRAERLYYPERTIKRICEGIIDPSKYVEFYYDVKKEDAIELLETIARLPSDTPKFDPDFRFQKSNLFLPQD